MVRIGKVSESYGWLGNMSPYPVIYDDVQWRTTEALFQALRFNDSHIKELIRLEKSPMGAKFKSKRFRGNMIVQPMSNLDVGNMELVLRLKIKQHPVIKAGLVSTGNQLIYEDVSNRKGGRHLFWGMRKEDGVWVGENVLGKLWMKLREEL
jgi:predicted NAD-dependent protein-ADP-ribosyltransferase YbiA (DUF1768 family)